MSWSSQGVPRRDPGASYDPMDDLALIGPRRSAGVTIVIVSLLAGAGTMAALVFGLGPQKHRVPALVGASLEHARGLVVERGLALIITGRRPDALVAKGSVASQSPLARRKLAEGGAVIVELSSGPPAPGRAAAGTPRRAAPPRTPPAPLPGSARTPPPAAKTAPKEPARTAAPAAPSGDQVVVPRVTGIKLKYARGRLAKAGLQIGRLRYKSDEDHMEGMVLRQRPRAKSTVARGTAIDLTINRID